MGMRADTDRTGYTSSTGLLGVRIRFGDLSGLSGRWGVMCRWPAAFMPGMDCALDMTIGAKALAEDFDRKCPRE